MDPIALVVIGVVLAGVAWWMLSDKDDTPPPRKPAPPTTVAPGGRRSEAPIPPEAKQAAKAKAAAKAKPASEKLPTVKTMEGMTKAKLEDLGRKFSVELDKRKTKANMIADLRAGVKK